MESLEKGVDPLAEARTQTQMEALEYLESKLRMICLLREKTFPAQRDLIQETVHVMTVPEQARDMTPRKASIKTIIKNSSPQSKRKQNQDLPKPFSKSTNLAPAKEKLQDVIQIEAVTEVPAEYEIAEESVMKELSSNSQDVNLETQKQIVTEVLEQLDDQKDQNTTAHEESKQEESRESAALNTTGEVTDETFLDSTMLYRSRSAPRLTA